MVMLNAQEVDPLGIQSAPVRVLDFRKHGNSLEAFRAARVEVMPEWKYYGQDKPKPSEENTAQYIARAGRYEILLPNNIRIRQDAFELRIRLKREGRGFDSPTTDQLGGMTIISSKRATLDDVNALAKSFISQGGIAKKGFWEWIEKRKNQGYAGDASVGIPEGMNPRMGFSLRTTFDEGAKYAAIMDIDIGWKGGPNDAPEGFGIDWDVPAIMESVPKPEGLHPLEAYVGIVGVEKLWELGMPKPKTMTVAEWRKLHVEGKAASNTLQPTQRKPPEVEKKSSVNEEAKPEERGKLPWIVAGVSLLGVLILLLKAIKNKSTS